LAADPAYTEALCNLATVLVDREKPQEALDLLRPREAHCSTAADWHRAMGRACLALDSLDLAEISFRRSIALTSGVAASHLGLAEVLHKKNQPELSLIAAKRAQELDPDSAAALYHVGQCEADLGHTDTALALFTRAIEMEPKAVGALIARGHLAMELGDAEKARADFAAARLAKPDLLSGLLAELKLRKVTADDPSLAELERRVADIETLVPDRAVSLLYALGKCYDDLGRYDAAFGAFAQGAALKRSKITYDADAYADAVDRLMSACDRAALDRLRGAALSDSRAIFVMGMPRSGTTMTESILASHPDVVGAGELPFLPRLLPMIATQTSTSVHGLITGNPSEIAQRFTQYLGASAETTALHPRFTDKMPCNFQYAGLIHALLPQAKIVHVLRDPVDTCLSNFTRLFYRSQYQSYDLVELGRYYRAYQRLMDHWAQVLPPDAIHHVRYEDLVDDTETHARRLLSACGLDWTDACLRFQDQKRRVRTASVTQVREPVYKTSVQKWRTYAPHLTPLLQTLGPLVAMP
jgi:tetratricopeptide (TPR) repeat protein